MALVGAFRCADLAYAVKQRYLRSSGRTTLTRKLTLSTSEWVSSEEPSDTKYLLLKRPEEGLLAGMWELPSQDLQAGSRRRERVSALQTLLERAVADAPSLSSATDLEPVVHKFSHITRTYIPVYVTVSSPSPPTMLLPDAKAAWRDASSVLQSNIPGAIKTIFTNFRQPSGASSSKGKKRGRTGGGSSMAATGQKSVSRFFSKPVQKPSPESARRASARSQQGATAKESPRARKVRVIAISDSEED